jgi:hypothetical protein
MGWNTKEFIRFIALFNRGFGLEMRYLILGHGYGSDGGTTHAALWRRYQEVSFGPNDCLSHKIEVPMYAGYLQVEDRQIVIKEGGSQTLRISPDKDKEKLVVKFATEFQWFNEPLIALYPLIQHGEVQHVLLC